MPCPITGCPRPYSKKNSQLIPRTGRQVCPRRTRVGFDITLNEIRQHVRRRVHLHPGPGGVLGLPARHELKASCTPYSSSRLSPRTRRCSRPQGRRHWRRQRGHRLGPDRAAQRFGGDRRVRARAQGHAGHVEETDAGRGEGSEFIFLATPAPHRGRPATAASRPWKPSRPAWESSTPRPPQADRH